MNTPLLHVETVRLRLGKQTFGAFDLRVAAGERIAILGPSAAGKSTLLKLLSGEYPPLTGSITLHGKTMRAWSWPELSRRRAVLPQTHEVAFGLPVELIIALGRVMRRFDPQRDHIVRQAAELARCAHLLGQRSDTLSGGERARVQLARIFAQLWDTRDGLVLVDEPLAALDPGLQLELLAALDDYCSVRNHALVAILHDVQQALTHFARLWLIRDRQLVGDLASAPLCRPELHALLPLERLYGVRFLRGTGAQGECLIVPASLRVSEPDLHRCA